MNISRNKYSHDGTLAEWKIGFRPFEWIRFQVLKLIYELSFLFLLRDVSWKEPLLTSLGADAPCRILSFGRGALSTARTLALRSPAANVIVVESKPGAIKRALRRITQKQIPNLMIAEASPSGPLPFETGYFDKVVLVLAFHSRVLEEKLCIAEEMLRILRHGGMLHIAAYDKPSMPEERSLLTLTWYLSGPTAAVPHLDGSWIKILTKAGFAGIRRQASCSVVGARISVVRARKP